MDFGVRIYGVANFGEVGIYHRKMDSIRGACLPVPPHAEEKWSTVWRAQVPKIAPPRKTAVRNVAG
jgi:hypothetical protein